MEELSTFNFKYTVGDDTVEILGRLQATVRNLINANGLTASSENSETMAEIHGVEFIGLEMANGIGALTVKIKGSMVVLDK